MSFSLVLLVLHNLFFFAVRAVAICVLPQRHSPSVAITWLLVILFWPLPGGALYLLLGSTQLPRLRKERHEKAMARLREAMNSGVRCATPRVPAEYGRISGLGRKLASWPVQFARDMDLIAGEEHLIARLVADIDRAEKTVSLLYYIFDHDEVTAPLLESLERAARRGVVCHLLVDDLGSKKFVKKHLKRLRQADVHVARALPLSRLRRGKLTARFDLRNHRKLAIIDGAVGYMGSHNITEPTYGGKAGGRSWKDLTLRLTGPIVAQLRGVFLEDWYVETDEILEHALPDEDVGLCGEFLLQTVPSGPAYSTENYQRLVASALFEARERVIITTPYLIPDEGLLQALEVACLNGAVVDLIIPEKGDQFFVGNAARAYYGELMEKGIRIHLFSPDLLHAKTMTVDGKMAFFGSSNFDIRSFALNFELNMGLYGTHETAMIRTAQEAYLRQSRLLDPEEWARRPLLNRTIEGVAKLLSPIL